jgi:AraC family transcriptional regulator of adaptative response / DNA-3-methyladenine glycosylase II
MGSRTELQASETPAADFGQHPENRDESLLDPAICWQAIYSRDRRFDGRFFAAATSTGLYCRSTCPVPFARPKNIVLFACAAAAEGAGFRPCRRCNPQASPGTPAWLGTSAVVSRAVRLIWEGALDTNGVEDLAERVGIGSRHLRRLFTQHLGASPAQIAGTQRVHFARKLIDETDLPMTQVALSAGFTSIRQFNHAMKGATGRAPSALRRNRDSVEKGSHQKGLVIRLPYRPPLSWFALTRFLEERATLGVELVGTDSYQRTIETNGMTGTLTVEHDAVDCRLMVRVALPDYQLLMPLVERVKRIFDLEADPLHIAGALARDPQMKPLIESLPGLRVPGVWDGFELGVKAVLGERLMGGGSRKLVARLVSRFGKPVETSIKGLHRVFPRADVLVNADLEREIGLRADQAAGIRMLAGLVKKGQLTMDASTTLEDTLARLVSIPCVTHDTAQYIAMRAFGEPDAFPAEHRCEENSRFGERWRPWRGYAAMHMWAEGRRLAIAK